MCRRPGRVDWRECLAAGWLIVAAALCLRSEAKCENGERASGLHWVAHARPASKWAPRSARAIRSLVRPLARSPASKRKRTTLMRAACVSDNRSAPAERRTSGRGTKTTKAPSLLRSFAPSACAQLSLAPARRTRLEPGWGQLSPGQPALAGRTGLFAWRRPSLAKKLESSSWAEGKEKEREKGEEGARKSGGTQSSPNRRPAPLCRREIGRPASVFVRRVCEIGPALNQVQSPRAADKSGEQRLASFPGGAAKVARASQD